MKRDREYVDLTVTQYNTAKCLSYAGGACWLRSPDFPERLLVIACTPVEIRGYFDRDANNTVRASLVLDDDAIRKTPEYLAAKSALDTFKAKHGNKFLFKQPPYSKSTQQYFDRLSKLEDKIADCFVR